MVGIDVAMAIMLLVIFIGGTVTGLVVAVSVASRREDRLYSLTGEAPDSLCRGARWLIGAGSRGWSAGDPPEFGEDLPAHGREPER